MKQTFAANLEQLPAMIQFIVTHAHTNGMDGKRLNRVEVVAEEALVNIINYGFEQGIGEIEICCSDVQNDLEIVIRDRGIAFNPLLDSPQVDIESPLEQRKVGGYGIFLIKEIMDDVRYERDGNTNVLRMTKKL